MSGSGHGEIEMLRLLLNLDFEPLTKNGRMPEYRFTHSRFQLHSLVLNRSMGGKDRNGITFDAHIVTCESDHSSERYRSNIMLYRVHKAKTC
jgi:hypothetical protein